MNYSYFVFYERIHHPGSGFKFPCTEGGDLLTQFMTQAQLANLRNCRENRWQEFRDPRVVRSNEVNHIN